MNELTTFEAIEVVTRILRAFKELAIMFWGFTGIGKSEIARQSVRALGNGGELWSPKPGVMPTGALEIYGSWGLIDMRVSLREPTDLLGLPDLKCESVRWVVPDELPVVGQEHRFPKDGILFLDELTHASTAMQNACYSLILDRRVGPHQLMPGWRIVAASNSGAENANTFPMSAPLRNRFVHLHIRPSLDAFKQWALANGVDTRIIAFLNFNPEFLHKATDHGEEGFPTPRAWTVASKLLGIFNDQQIERALAGAVGPGTATVLSGFLAMNDSSELNVDTVRLLAGKVKCPKLTLERPDHAWALTGRVTAAVRERPERLASAIGFYCSSAWKEVREIGRTGLADLKHLVGQEGFSQALAQHMEQCAKFYGDLL